MSPTNLFATLIAAALVACGTAGDPAAASDPPDAYAPAAAAGEEIPFETVEQRSVPGKGGGEVREAVKDDAEWQRVWDDLAGGSGLPEEAPAVDFEEQMVIAAAMPTQGCVSRVTIRGIRAEGGGLVVDLLEQPPAEGIVCVVSERPFHAVRLARRDGEVRWKVEVVPLDPG